jgi:hypothetical protein
MEFFAQCLAFHLMQRIDKSRWSLHENRKFLVDLISKAIIQPNVSVDNNSKIWKLKIPLKTKIFMWYLGREVILTKDNLLKRNWNGSSKCVFCHNDETTKHFFSHCKFMRSIWSPYIYHLALIIYFTVG